MPDLTNPYTELPLVYVAGPYTAPDPCENTHTVIRYGNELLDRRLAVPFIPHLSHFWHTVTPRPYQDWIDLDLKYVEKCDGLIRLPGASSGADGEVDFALKLGIPVLIETEPWNFGAVASFIENRVAG